MKRGTSRPEGSKVNRRIALVLYPMLRGDMRINRSEGVVLVVALLAWVAFQLFLL